MNRHVFEPNGWWKFSFVNWNDPIASRVRLVNTVAVYLPAAEFETISSAAGLDAGRTGRRERWSKLQGIQLRMVRYLPERHINPRICWSRLFAVLTRRILLFPMLRESLPRPVTASSLIGQSVVDMMKRVMSEYDQTFRYTVLH